MLLGAKKRPDGRRGQPMGRGGGVYLGRGCCERVGHGRPALGRVPGAAAQPQERRQRQQGLAEPAGQLGCTSVRLLGRKRVTEELKGSEDVLLNQSSSGTLNVLALSCALARTFLPPWASPTTYPLKTSPSRQANTREIFEHLDSK